ncbi:MAG: hypothetical protein MZW92_67505 [Comamonadaceae bacterium]|nr:hypothetical protein [Comamonadaceae bacterium]
MLQRRRRPHAAAAADLRPVRGDLHARAGRRRSAASARSEFLEDLADLVENRPPTALERAPRRGRQPTTERFDFARADYRILIALREDYLAHLEGAEGHDALDHAEPHAARAHERRAGARAR